MFAGFAILAAMALSVSAQPDLQIAPRPGDPLPSPSVVHTPQEAGLTLPRLIHPAKAKHTDEARKAKFRGICMVQLVVDAQGIPKNVHVTKPLGMGLEKSAIEAVKQERFEPGRYLGYPVAVAMSLKVSFDSAQ